MRKKNKFMSEREETEKKENDGQKELEGMRQRVEANMSRYLSQRGTRRGGAYGSQSGTKRGGIFGGGTKHEEPITAEEPKTGTYHRKGTKHKEPIT